MKLVEIPGHTQLAQNGQKSLSTYSLIGSLKHLDTSYLEVRSIELLCVWEYKQQHILQPNTPHKNVFYFELYKFLKFAHDKNFHKYNRFSVPTLSNYC